MNTYMLKNGETLIIRRGTVEDAVRLSHYISRVAGQSDFLTFEPGEVTGINNTSNEKPHKASGLVLLAVVNGRLVGNLNFMRGARSKIWHAGEFGITVDKLYWGQGIGRQLIACLLEWAHKQKNIRKVNLKVRSDNERAIILYKRMGFKEEGLLRREFYSNEIFYDALCMGLCID
ncbi:MAG: GNAT family N-acetyltransferase [Pelosinus sp.]|nr:GNAT family N-acetyltransferase [Pelosinus sp.]